MKYHCDYRCNCHDQHYDTREEIQLHYRHQDFLKYKQRIYVASSWRNEKQAEVVSAIRDKGHEVYDFKNPAEGDKGFHWSEIDPNWKQWTGEQYVDSLRHPKAKAGFDSDITAMEWATAFVLVQPCGRSAHLEMGWAAGRGKLTMMLLAPEIEPELMAKMCDFIVTDMSELLNLFGDLTEKSKEKV